MSASEDQQEDPHEALLEAAWAGDAAAVKRLAASGADVNAQALRDGADANGTGRWSAGQTALHVVILHGGLLVERMSPGMSMRRDDAAAAFLLGLATANAVNAGPRPLSDEALAWVGATSAAHKPPSPPPLHHRTLSKATSASKIGLQFASDTGSSSSAFSINTAPSLPHEWSISAGGGGAGAGGGGGSSAAGGLNGSKNAAAGQSSSSLVEGQQQRERERSCCVGLLNEDIIAIILQHLIPCHHCACLQALLGLAGAKVDVLDVWGMPPTSIAYHRGQRRALRILEEAGADMVLKSVEFG